MVLLLYLLFGFEGALSDYLHLHMTASASPKSIIQILKLILLASLAYLFVRALSALLFGLVFRLKSGYEAPTLARNIFSIVAFTIFFIVIFNKLFPDINLGALFTTSAIFGVILGLALQDTLGNFLRRASHFMPTGRFRLAMWSVVGQQRLTGVVEGITWRAIKIRTFQNHLVLLSNSSVAKEAIEVCPRTNLERPTGLLQHVVHRLARQRRFTLFAKRFAKRITSRRRSHQLCASGIWARAALNTKSSTGSTTTPVTTIRMLWSAKESGTRSVAPA